jgi:hypothetical protein
VLAADLDALLVLRRAIHFAALLVLRLRASPEERRSTDNDQYHANNSTPHHPDSLPLGYSGSSFRGPTPLEGADR